MILNPIRAVRCWKIDRDISRKLAARKALRPYRKQAALKGWHTRRLT